MRKAALIFALAVFIPALILGGLALRTASSQRMLLERQEAELRQQETDSIAALVRAAMASEHQAFVQSVDQLLRERGAESLARSFNQVLPSAWRAGAVGFAATMRGNILSPESASVRAEDERFLKNNAAFFGNQLSAQVYQAEPNVLAQISLQKGMSRGQGFSADVGKAEQNARRESQQASASAAIAKKDVFTRGPQTEEKLKRDSDRQERSDLPNAALNAELAEAQQSVSQSRKVSPQKDVTRTDQPPASQLNVETSMFQQIVTSQNEGILARFVQDQLEILFWVRPKGAPGYVFGAQLRPADLHPWLDPIFTSETAQAPGACIAVLDDRARPFTRSVASFTGEWKRPFVATEIGEVLPHWEIALYLLDPGRIARSARLVNLTLGTLIALALAAILWGGYMVVAETRRQMALVQKKADFVSNVSHELKTPLTSIRMFAELLYENRVTDPDKREKYLRVITLESDRLTRLINNVLDFARIERNQKEYNKREIDLHPVLRKLWEAQEMHLQSEGFATAWKADPPPYPVFGDDDALAQVIVNLLSNAEKYSTEKKEIEMTSEVVDSAVVVRVLDRGPGVPRGEEEKIFESFYRAHDSLSSGIQGSGLGLTLARQIAREHGGDISCEPRTGGGAVFTLKLPKHVPSGTVCAAGE